MHIYLSIRVGEEREEARKSLSINHGPDTVIKATSEAADGDSRLNQERICRIRIGNVGRRRGEDFDDGWDSAEAEEGELLGAVADDLILEVAEGFELNGVVRGSGAQAGEKVLLGGGRRCGGWHFRRRERGYIQLRERE